jgi:hypothetical protein
MESQLQSYDIGLVWNWVYDQEFLQLIVSAVRAKGLSAFLIDQMNLAETIEQLKDDRIQFRFILDRASDEDERFLPLAQSFTRRQSGSTRRPPLHIINPYDVLRRASDKATMHLNS